MSISKPSEGPSRNPATKYIDFKGGDEQGYFQYYDKDIEDKSKRNVKVDLSKGFVVLDGIDSQIFSITGFDESTNSGIISNEVRSMDDLIHIRKYVDGKAVTLMKGSYNELKDAIKDNRMYSYTRCFYIMFEGELCHLKVSGAGLRQWFTDVQPNMNAASSFIKVKEIILQKKGNVKYNVPIWEVGKRIDEKTLEMAIEMDSQILQPYLSKYFSRDGKPSDSDPASRENIDTSKWREIESPDGIKLCQLDRNQLIDLQESLESSGDMKIIDFVGHALYEYQQAEDIWKHQRSKAKGKTLAEFTIDEIRQALKAIPPAHPSKIMLDCALDSKLAEEQDSLLDGDDIPF